MEKLTNSEIQIMGFIWKKEVLFLREIIEQYPDPKPAKTTIATHLKRLYKKKYIDYKLFGNSRRYFCLIKKEDYFSKHFQGIALAHFNNSLQELFEFIAKNLGNNRNNLDIIKKIIDNKLREQQKKDAMFF